MLTREEAMKPRERIRFIATIDTLKRVAEDFNPNGTRVGFLSDDGFISAFWWDYQDCYETISKLNCESNKDFYRSHLDNTEPEFWFPIPKFVNPLKNRR